MKPTILETCRLHSSTPAQSPVSTPLSILDATVVRFASTGAIWIFDSSPATPNAEHLAEHLKNTFKETLNAFPQWTGQLQWCLYREDGTHTERFKRPRTVYGTDNDPGVEWSVAQLDQSVSGLVPECDVRISNAAWVGGFPQAALMASPTPLALHDVDEYEGLPGMIVQITLLIDGGYAVAVKLAHPLADAQSLTLFMRRWSCISCHLLSNQGSAEPSPNPVFDPSLLDSRAFGDIDSPAADPDLLSISRALPMHRYNWWDTTSGHLLPTKKPTTNSKPTDPELLKKAMLSPAVPPPWDSWSLTKPVSTALLHFGAPELERLRASVKVDNPGIISRLDALLAHLWICVNRARAPALKSSDQVYLDLSLGVRPRLSPPLLDKFVGSPIILANISNPLEDIIGPDSSIAQVASRIRACLGQFTPEAVGAVLHDEAHEVAPQRLWRAFVGTRHTLVTSWARLGIYDVTFDGDTKPKYVHPIMVSIDGILCVVDSGLPDGGLDVSLCLDTNSMMRFLNDRTLYID